MGTPSNFAKGVWKVQTPFVVDAATSYTAIAIRSFQDIRSDGGNVFESIYQPAGLTQAQYDADDQLAISVITLFAQGKDLLHIPDKYILEYPTTTANGYSRVVVGAEIGIVPDAIGLDYLKTELSQRLSQLTGFEVVVNLYSAPYTGTITPQQQASFERVRAAAVGSLQTVYARAEAAEAKVTQLQATVAALTKIIKDSGIVVPT